MEFVWIICCLIDCYFSCCICRQFLRTDCFWKVVLGYFLLDKSTSQNPNPNQTLTTSGKGGNFSGVQLPRHHEISVSLEKFIFIYKMHVLKIKVSSLTLFRMSLFEGQKAHPLLRPPPPPSFLKKSITHILQRWNLAQLHLTYRRPKICMNHLTPT